MQERTESTIERESQPDGTESGAPPQSTETQEAREARAQESAATQVEQINSAVDGSKSTRGKDSSEDSTQYEASSADGDDAELDPIARLEQQLAEANARADEYLDKHQRSAAEFQNARKRQEKQLSDSIQRASQRLILKLLPVLDDLDLAFQNIPEDLNEQETAWLGGFRQIQKKMTSLLEDEGVQLIETEGEFNPERHEAISSEPSDEVESGHVIATLRPGYEQSGRVLRPALVRVAA